MSESRSAKTPESPDAPARQAGSASWIYDQLQELAASLAPGTPLPPVSLLKSNYKVGYEALNQVLKALEASGWVAIRRNKGIFALRPDLREPPEVSAAGETAVPAGEESGYAMPWLQRTHRHLQLLLFDSYAPSVRSWQRLVKLYHQRSPFYRLEIIERSPEQAAELNDPEYAFDLAVFSSHITRRLQLRPGTALPLTELAGAAIRTETWYPFTWGRDVTQEVTGIIPRAVTMLLEYDRDTVRPTGFPRTETPTPEELLDCARALQLSRCDRPVLLFLGYMAWFCRFQVPLCDPSGGAMAITAENLYPVLHFLEQLSNGTHLAPLCSEAYARYYSTRPREVHVPLTESWLTSQDRPGSEFVPMPRIPTGTEPLFGPEIIIGSKSFYPEECWNFIQFVLSEEGQQAMGALLPCVPARRNQTAQSVTPARHRSLAIAAAHGELVYTRNPWLFEARFIIELLIERYLKHEISLDMLTRTLNERGSRFMEKFARP